VYANAILLANQKKRIFGCASALAEEKIGWVPPAPEEAR
jgi:hypothetical protein